jgi:hypothetical protein
MLYVMSLFRKRRRKYGKRLARARRELAAFLDAFEAEAGTEAAGVLRAYAQVRCSSRQENQPPDGPPTVFDEVRRLKRKAATLSRKLHSPACCYRERRRPPYVLWHYGVTWADLGRLAEDGRLPLEHVLRLLRMLLNRKPDREVVGRGPAFRQRRRWLVRFLMTAAKLEEDVRCGSC